VPAQDGAAKPEQTPIWETYRRAEGHRAVVAACTGNSYDANVAPDACPARAFSRNTLVYGVHQVRESARKGTVGHALSPVESRGKGGK